MLVVFRVGWGDKVELVGSGGGFFYHQQLQKVPAEMALSKQPLSSQFPPSQRLLRRTGQCEDKELPPCGLASPRH